MFTPKQSVQWEAERFKFIRQYTKNEQTVIRATTLATIQRSNYAKLLVAAFTVLFNERQKKGSYHGNR